MQGMSQRRQSFLQGSLILGFLDRGLLRDPDSSHAVDSATSRYHCIFVLTVVNLAYRVA
jgi:hypothetical protein